MTLGGWRRGRARAEVTHPQPLGATAGLTPESSTEDLRVEALLVLADLGGVAVGADVGGVHVHHRDLACLVQLGLLLPEQLTGEQGCQGSTRAQRGLEVRMG